MAHPTAAATRAVRVLKEAIVAEHEILVSVQVDARKRHFEVTTLKRGKGRHIHYATLREAPPEIRGEALQLIRLGLTNAGYESLTDLEEALTSELVVPADEDED
jgi:hypothetical protein